MPNRPQTHRPAHQTRAPDHRPSAAKRGYGRTHQKERKRCITSEPCCVQCLQETPPRVTPATVMDHVIPIRDAPHLQHDPANHQPLCARHHALKTRRGE